MFKLTDYFQKEKLEKKILISRITKPFSEAFAIALKEFCNQLNHPLMEELRKRIREIRECREPIKLMAYAMWCFNIVANLGVITGLKPCDPVETVANIIIPEDMDKAATTKLLTAISNVLCLQNLPEDLRGDEE